MSDRPAPPHLRSLSQRIVNAAKAASVPDLRLRQSIAHTIVGQMLPAGVVKGGAAVRMRVTEAEARLTRDLDFSPVADTDPEAFIAEFEANLERGSEGFTGHLVEKEKASPRGVPGEYVMAPYEVKLDHKGRSWCTVVFELGSDEAESTADPDVLIAADIVKVFDEIGLPEPEPIPLMSVARQAAQKLHACTSESGPGASNDRAHDLVDLQILHRVETIDTAELSEVAPRLFTYRKRHAWPPVIVAHPGWGLLYANAAAGLEVFPDVVAAVEWANELVTAVCDGKPAPAVPGLAPDPLENRDG